MSKYIIVFQLLLSSVCFGQDWGSQPKADVPQVQVTFLSAKAAEVAPTGDGKVAILAEELAPKQEHGVIVTLASDIKWVEVHPSSKPFPAIIVQPYKEHKFLIRGAPGDKFFVSARGGDLPVWFDVLIAPVGSPPPPVTPPEPGNPQDPQPPATLPGLEGIKQLSSSKADAISDEATRVELKTAIQTAIRTIEASCSKGQCPGLDQSKTIVVSHIDACMLASKNVSLQWWSGWRKPISDEIKKRNPADVPTYLAMMRAAAEGL